MPILTNVGQRMWYCKAFRLSTALYRGRECCRGRSTAGFLESFRRMRFSCWKDSPDGGRVGQVSKGGDCVCRDDLMSL